MTHALEFTGRNVHVRVEIDVGKVPPEKREAAALEALESLRPGILAAIEGATHVGTAPELVDISPIDRPNDY